MTYKKFSIYSKYFLLVMAMFTGLLSACRDEDGNAVGGCECLRLVASGSWERPSGQYFPAYLGERCKSADVLSRLSNSRDLGGPVGAHERGFRRPKASKFHAGRAPSHEYSSGGFVDAGGGPFMRDMKDIPHALLLEELERRRSSAATTVTSESETARTVGCSAQTSVASVDGKDSSGSEGEDSGECAVGFGLSSCARSDDSRDCSEGECDVVPGQLSSASVGFSCVLSLRTDPSLLAPLIEEGFEGGLEGEEVPTPRGSSVRRGAGLAAPESPFPFDRGVPADPGILGKVQAGDVPSIVIYADELVCVSVGILSGSFNITLKPKDHAVFERLNRLPAKDRQAQLLELYRADPDGFTVMGVTPFALQLTFAKDAVSGGDARSWRKVDPSTSERAAFVHKAFELVAVKYEVIPADQDSVGSREWDNHNAPFQTVNWPHYNVAWSDSSRSSEVLNSRGFKLDLAGFTQYLIDHFDASKVRLKTAPEMNRLWTLFKKDQARA